MFWAMPKILGGKKRFRVGRQNLPKTPQGILIFPVYRVLATGDVRNGVYRRSEDCSAFALRERLCPGRLEVFDKEFRFFRRGRVRRFCAPGGGEVGDRYADEDYLFVEPQAAPVVDGAHFIVLKAHLVHAPVGVSDHDRCLKLVYQIFGIGGDSVYPFGPGGGRLEVEQGVVGWRPKLISSRSVPTLREGFHA